MRIFVFDSTMPSNTFSIFKKTLKWLTILVLALFTMSILLSIFYEKEIKALIVSELNKNLTTEIHVEDFNFSLIRHFPFASLEMKKVLIKDAIDEQPKDTLLYAEHLSLLFNFFEVFNKDVSVRKLIVKDGLARIKVDSTGKVNYHFWKKSEKKTEGGVIDLRKIILKNMDLMYADKKDRQDYTFHADQAELSGKFGKDQFQLSCDASLFVHRLWIHGVNYISGKKVILRSGIDVNSALQTYRFPESHVQVADVKFDVDGSIDNSKKNWMLDIAVKSKEADMTSFISLLPAPYVKYLKEFKSTGRFLFCTSIKGSVEGKNIPNVQVDFSIRDGKFTAIDAPAALEQLNVSGIYKNRSLNGKSQLIIPSLSAQLAGHPIKADIRIDDLENAFLTAHASATLDLAKVKPFIHADTLKSLTGTVSLNVSYAGKVQDIKTASKLYEVNASGSISFSNVAFQFKNNPLEFKNLNGLFNLNNRDVDIKNFTGNLSSSDFKLNGVFKNFISFLLIPGQSGELQAGLKASSINLDELLVNKSTSGSSDTSYIMKFNPRLICTLQVDVDQLHFRRFKAADITGQINLRNQIISGKNLVFTAMNGKVQMDATINAARRDSVFMTYDTRFSKIDITRLFYEMENFDQNTMTDKNVKGVLIADVQFTSAWSNSLTLNSKSVRSTCSITIENGELLNFLPIQAMARYIHVPDLNTIHFSNLTNTISIADRKISIPFMEIQSSAINISGNGIHDFENNIDYHLRLLLSDVLGNKMKKNSSEFGEVEDDGLGRSKLFLSMKGNVKNPKFTLDRKATAEKVKTDIKNEKQNLKAMLKEEFGLFKKDTAVVKKQKKKEEMQVEWE